MAQPIENLEPEMSTTATRTTLKDRFEDDEHVAKLRAQIAELQAKGDLDAAIPTTCWKCNGRGTYPSPLDGGRCWGCAGTGKGAPTSRRQQIKGLQSDISGRKKALAKAADMEARYSSPEAVAWRDENADVVAEVEESDAVLGSFMGSMAEALRKHGVLTPGQADAVRRGITRRKVQEAERADAEPCPSGRVTVTGEIVSSKVQEDRFGASRKMTVRDDRGFRVWGTAPRALGPVAAGDRVTFEADVTPSDDDPTFGFAKRPSKVSKLDE